MTATKNRKLKPRRKLDYSGRVKTENRERGLARVIKRRGNYFTFASSYGHCVRYILSKNPNHTVHSCESEFDAFSEFLEYGFIPYENNYPGEFSDCIRDDKFEGTKYRHLNLDMMGYASGPLYIDLRHISDLHNAEHITITLGKTTDKIRNTLDDPFRVWAEKEFSGDVTLKSLEHALENYDYVDDWEYKGNVVMMRMYTFKRKKGLK